MNRSKPNEPAWRKSDFCDSGTCVEVAFTADYVLMRDSNDLTGPQLTVSRAAWASFIEEIKQTY